MMRNLTERQIKCMKLLLEEQQYRSASYYSERLHISNKTFLQELKALQKYLDEFGITLERKTGYGIYLEKEARRHRELLNDLERQQNVEKTVSVTSRRWEILRRMLMYPEVKTSIQRLSEEFYVSRASIVNDFKYIEGWLQSYELKLVKDTDGHHVSGDENGIRQAISAISSEYQAPVKAERPQGHSSLDEDTRGGLTKLFPVEKVRAIESMLADLENESGCMIREPYYINLLTHILICLFRTQQGKRIEKTDGTIDIRTYKSFEYAKELAAAIKAEFNLDIGEAEIYYIYKYLISSGVGIEKNDVRRVEVMEESRIEEAIASDMTGCISKALQIDISKNRQLEEGLLLHIRPMLNRLKYGISIKSEILEEIQTNYGELLGLCQSVMWCMSQKYSLKEAGLDELSYIATYYQAMVEAGRMEKRVLVVCHSGFGTSQLLATKLHLNFPSWDIVDVISSRQLEKQWDLKDIDFIISTVPLEMTSVPYILVSAMLSDRDIQKVRNLVSIEKENSFFPSLMEKQFNKGELLFKEIESYKGMQPQGKSAHIQKELQWGGRVRLVMGIEDKKKTVIYRVGQASENWLLYTCAPDFDLLLDQMAELYPILCDPKRRQLLDKCHCTQDLKVLFQPFAGQELALIPKEMICMDLDAPDKETAIRQMLPLFTRAGIIGDEEEFYRDVIEREGMAVTSVGCYIALPHGKSDTVVRPGIAIGRLNKRILWTTDRSVNEDERYVQVIIMFAVHPEEDSREGSMYIRMLKHVFGRLGEPGVPERIFEAKDSETISRIFC